MSTPLPPPPPGSPGSGTPTSTQEIPVVPAAVANTQHLPPPPAPENMRSTGPVDFVPEPPPPAAPATSSSPTASATRRARPGAAWVATGVVAVGVLALELGLAAHSGGGSWWSRIPLWSSFATVAAVLVLLAVAGGALRDRAPLSVLRVGAAAVGGLGVFWLLVVLPVADTDRGFVLTAAVACLAAALWTVGRSKAAAS